MPIFTISTARRSKNATCEYEAEAKEGKIIGKEVEAIELWKKMLKMIFETGHPWITFKDPCNLRSPQDPLRCNSQLEPLH